jgi:hypothetical protein
MLWSGGVAKVWYNSTLIGSLTLPTSAPQNLIFQNNTFAFGCPGCLGPFKAGTIWLQQVKVWDKT